MSNYVMAQYGVRGLAPEVYGAKVQPKLLDGLVCAYSTIKQTVGAGAYMYYELLGVVL